MTKYLYDLKEWPNFTWDDKKIIILLGKTRSCQGKLIGKMESLGFSFGDETLKITTTEIIKSSEIENEKLNETEVYSSLAKNLGIDKPGLISSSRKVDGIVEMALDAVLNYNDPLTSERLFQWHLLLFTETHSPLKVIGNWSPNQMYVVSGKIPGKEVIEYTAPAPERTPIEMEKFLNWVNTEEEIDPVLKAGVAHIWFLLIHPFEDGNGRIARALTDMLLARADGTSSRFYSLSAQMQKQRKEYYAAIQKTQTGTLDITDWLIWFLKTLNQAFESSENIIPNVLQKTEFWNKYSEFSFNSRQIKIIKIMLEDFEGEMTTSKWAKITKTSQDTALRDIKDLIQKGVMEQKEESGRSTSYKLSDLK